MMERQQQRKYPLILSRIFHGIYRFLWLLLLPGILLICFYWDYKIILMLSLPVCILLFFFHKPIRLLGNQLFVKISAFIDRHSIISIVLVLMLIQVVLQLYFGYEMAITPSSDRKVIFKQASEIALTGNWHTTPKYTFYFLRYPNNQMLLILEAAYFSLLKMLGIQDFLYGNMVLNLFAIDSAIILCTILIYKKYGKKMAVFFQILAFLFLPFYTYIPFVYTDTLVLPMVAGILLCYELLEQHWNSRSWIRCILLLLIGILTWAGYELKPTVAIISIACFLHMCIAKELIAGLFYSFIIFMTFLICSISCHNVVLQLNLVDQTNYNRENFPYTHWVMMGLKGIGIYNLTDRQYTSSFETIQEKEKANISMIKTRLREYSVSGLIFHQYIKGVTTWHSGRYDMEFYLPRKNIRTSWLQTFFYPKGKFYHVYSLYCTIFQLFLLSMLTRSIFRGYRERQLDSAVMWKLSLFGLYLFLSVWETRPRYVMHFTPLLFLVAIDLMDKRKKERAIRLLENE